MWAKFQRIIELFTQKCHKALKDMSGIRDPEKTYSGSRIQWSKRHRIPDPDHCHRERKTERWHWVCSVFRSEMSPPTLSVVCLAHGRKFIRPWVGHTTQLFRGEGAACIFRSPVWILPVFAPASSERGETAVCEVFNSVVWTEIASFGQIGYEITLPDLNTDYRHALVTEPDFLNI
jgi:hypothetical protein